MSTAGRNRSPSIASESEATAEPVAALHPRVTMLAPVAMMQHNPSRRGSVSAESYQPRLQSTHEKRVVVPKSNEAKLRIAAATGQNLLFRNLETDQRQEVVDAMVEKKVKSGDVVIQQGDEGDNFYVVDEGLFEVFVNGKKVVEIGPGGSFGELALMYNTPRAATVKAVNDGVLWAVDRSVFRSCIVDNMFQKRMQYEEFLKQVPLLEGLTPAEVSKIADALEPVEFSDGDIIVEQGQPGDNFFFIYSGEAIVTKTQDDGEPEQVGTLKRGDYFGELALLTDQPRAATITAKGDVVCSCLSPQAFIRLLGPVKELLKRHAHLYAKYQYLEKAEN